MVERLHFVTVLRCSLLLAGIGGVWLIQSEVLAQNMILPDMTLGSEMSEITPLDELGLPVDVIDGGAIRGSNLFHSFSEFNIPENRGAYFRVPTNNIENILTRVTGSNPSNIMGTLGSFNDISVNAKPDFYFINSNGILFGPDAVLDLPASFLATTADAIELGDNGLYSAILPEFSNLLSVDPSALLFGSSPPEPIINQAVLGLPITGRLVNSSQSLPFIILPNGSRTPFPWGLQVSDGSTISLIGGNVILSGIATAMDGEIEISSIYGGRIQISDDEEVFSDSLENLRFGDIQITNGSLNTSGQGGGYIQIRAAQVFTNSDNVYSIISAITQGDLDGQGISIQATDSISVENIAFISAVSPGANGNGGDIFIESSGVSIRGAESSIGTRTFGNGQAGNIIIYADWLETQQGAAILTGTIGPGDGGNLTVIASDSVNLSGSSFAEEEAPGGLSADIIGSGTGGTININTSRLTLNDGANISARTDDGPGGSIFVEANNIELLGGSIQSQTFGRGEAGDIAIRAQNLLILEGNEITASAGFRTQGDAGNIDVIASELVEVDGSGGLITAVIGGGGNGGNLNIKTSQLVLRNGGTISAEAITLGEGGSIAITADRIYIDGNSDFLPSKISTTTASENENAIGNLFVNTRQLSVLNGGEITVDTLGSNAAGNLVIFADEFINLSGSYLDIFEEVRPSRISASTSGDSRSAGGNIKIFTQDFNISNGAEISVSSSGEGTAGDLFINANSLNISNQGAITGTSRSGNGGNLSFQLSERLLLRFGARISTTAGDSRSFGNGGDINVRAPFVIAVREEDSDITANAFLGRGGSVEITARGIFGLEFRSENTPFSDITASSDFGASGVVNLNTLDTGFIENNLTDLPQNLMGTESLISGACIARTEADQGTFVVTGNGGLPTRPGDTMLSTYPTTDVQSVRETQAVWQPGDPIVEPTGAFPLGDGRLVLSRECN